ncbi:MAG TPA: TIGR03086 family metal-binding protein [Kribbella sp.]|jgi:uncharacterized protein (TIGR03086 family)
MDRIDQFTRAKAVATQIVESISDDQLHLPTPCTEWDVHDILAHVLDGDLLVIDWIQGVTPLPREERTREYFSALLGDAPQAAVLAKLQECYDLFLAQDADRVVTSRMGDFSVADLVEKRIADLVAHLWDLAIAAGQPVDYDPELVESVLEHYHAKLAGKPREGAPVAEPQPVPEGATAADRLAAFLGRSVVTPITA